MLVFCEVVKGLFRETEGKTRKSRSIWRGNLE
jgi:hypothetical protein